MILYPWTCQLQITQVLPIISHSRHQELLALKKPHDLFNLPYKMHTQIWFPYFEKAYNAVDTGLSLPLNSLSEHIIVYPKEDKDHLFCPNYRPVSLLNTVRKLFTKRLDIQAMKYIPHIIQTRWALLPLGKPVKSLCYSPLMPKKAFDSVYRAFKIRLIYMKTFALLVSKEKI